MLPVLQNCEAGHDVPNTCQVGCAIVFPQFVETCRDHIRDQPELNEPDFEIFEEMCLEQDGLARGADVYVCLPDPTRKSNTFDRVDMVKQNDAQIHWIT